MRDYITYFNGEWLPWSQVHVDIDDLGFQLGDVVFEYARTFNGKPFTWEEHIDRLYRSLQYVRNDIDITEDEMLKIHYEIIERNEIYRDEVGDFNIIPFVTRGLSFEGKGNVFVRIKPINFREFIPWYETGVHGVIAKSRSYSSISLDPKVKHHSRMNMVLGTLEARDVDVNSSPIFMDVDGNISEGNAFNIMIVKDGVIKTPTDRSILQGVSRSVVIGLAKNIGIPISEENIQPYDLYTADEVFFVRSTPCIVPCSKVDNRNIGESDEFPGPVTKQLLAAYSELVGLDIIDQSKHYGNI